MSTSTPTADAPIAVGRGVDDVVLYVRGQSRPLRLTRKAALRLAELLAAAAGVPDIAAIFERNRANVYAENPTPRSTRIGDIKGSVVLDVPDEGSLT